MMQYAVYADMSRGLAEHERSALFAALDALVPGSGCVGIQQGSKDEVYFTLDAPPDAAANTQAAHYMNLILQKAGINLDHTLTLERKGHS